jgi:hypothetical protein
MEGIPGTDLIGGWVGPRAGLDAVVNRKILSPTGREPPRSTSPYSSAIPLSCSASRRRWEVNIKWILTLERQNVIQTHLVQWRAAVNTVMNLRVP